MNKTLLIALVGLMGLAANAADAAGTPTDASCPQGYKAVNKQCISETYYMFENCSEQTKQAIALSMDLQTLTTAEKNEFAQYNRIENVNHRLDARADQLQKIVQSLQQAKKDLNTKVDNISVIDRLAMSEEAKEKIAHAQHSIDLAISNISLEYDEVAGRGFRSLLSSTDVKQAQCVRALRSAMATVETMQNQKN